MIPSDRRGDMSDHHFIASGIHPSLLRKKAELKVLEHADSVTWSIEGRVYEARPQRTGGSAESMPGWTSISHSSRFCPRFGPGVFGLPNRRTDLVRHHVCGDRHHNGCRPNISDRCARYSGTHDLSARRSTILRTTPLTTPSIGTTWSAPTSPSCSSDIPVRGRTWPSVHTGGEDIYYGTGEITHTVRDYWADRRSGLSIPSKWNLVLASPRGTLVLDIAAHGRAFLPWVMKPGLRLEIWMLATANGMFLDADGTRTLVTDQLMVVNPLQFLTYAEENLDGTLCTSVSTCSRGRDHQLSSKARRDHLASNT